MKIFQSASHSDLHSKPDEEIAKLLYKEGQLLEENVISQRAMSLCWKS